MRIYFLNDDNLQEINENFNDLYINTIKTFDHILEKYRVEIKNTTDLNEERILKISINELVDTIDQLKYKDFEIFYVKQVMINLEKIRYASVTGHSNKCIIRAVFDLLFKYYIDFEYKIPYLCCNNTRFKKLQFEILRDLRWKIRT